MANAIAQPITVYRLFRKNQLLRLKVINIWRYFDGIGHNKEYFNNEWSN